MYRLDFDDIPFTEEELLLRKKYQQLRVKAEQVKRYELEQAKQRRANEEDEKRKMAEAEAAAARDAENNAAKEAREKVKQLIRSGKITISRPEEVKSSFKKATVLEKRRTATDGNSGNLPVKMLRVSANEEGFKKESGGSLSLSCNHPKEDKVQASTSGPGFQERREAPALAAALPAALPAALAWRTSIESERSSRRGGGSKSGGGGYTDFKRRLIKYSSSSDSSDEN